MSGNNIKDTEKWIKDKMSNIDFGDQDQAKFAFLLSEQGREELQSELDSVRTSHKALETLYHQVRDEELVKLQEEIERMKETIAVRDMMVKDLRESKKTPF